MLGVHILMFLQESSRDTASSNNSKLVNSHISNRPLNYGPILPIFTNLEFFRFNNVRVIIFLLKRQPFKPFVNPNTILPGFHHC